MRRARTAAANLVQSFATARHIANVARPRHPLFLMSHTRSYSSLLCHILNSNPAIDGYGELWIDYRSQLDLLAMRHKIAITTGAGLHGRYTLDKLLHNKLDVADDVLRAPSTRVMIGIREPEGTVRSNLVAGQVPNAPAWKRTPKAATNHYINRVEELVRIAERRTDAAVFPMDALITQTGDFLDGLTDWLQLTERLTPTYEVGPRTGTPTFGDTSENIRSGSVRREREEHAVEIPDDQLDRLWTAYGAAMSALSDRCETWLSRDAIVRRPD